MGRSFYLTLVLMLVGAHMSEFARIPGYYPRRMGYGLRQTMTCVPKGAGFMSDSCRNVGRCGVIDRPTVSIVETTLLLGRTLSFGKALPVG